MARTGRPPSYNKTMPIAAGLLASQGQTVLEICTVLGIGRRTFFTWCKKYPDFKHAVDEGREKKDDLVEAAAYKRAVGYGFEETKEEYEYAYDDETGEAAKRLKTLQTTKKELPGDPRSQQFWLRNRRPEKWNRADEKVAEKTNTPGVIVIPGKLNPQDWVEAQEDEDEQ